MISKSVLRLSSSYFLLLLLFFFVFGLLFPLSGCTFESPGMASTFMHRTSADIIKYSSQTSIK